MIAGMGASFCLLDGMTETLADKLKARGFCTYHQMDFEQLSQM